MCAFNNLRVTPFSRATSGWANSVVDALNMLYDIGSSSIKYSDLTHLGYDIIPDKDNLRDLGDEERAWRDVHAHYGYFKDNLFVQGKRVIKDGDPVNIYDIFSPAESKIRKAIDTSRLTELIGEVRDKVVKVSIDEYGRVGVIISEPIDEYGRVRTSTEEAFTPVSNRASVTASQNAYGVSVSLITNGRPNVNVYYKLGGAGDVYVEVSLDGTTWRVLEHITLSESSEGLKIYQGIAYKYVRARVPTTSIDVELEITASR